MKERELTFSRALKPADIKSQTDNWAKVEGYVYLISKKMKPHPRDPELKCVKIGFSNTTKEKFEKGYARLLGFRTSLISFNVHRIYLFGPNDFDKGEKEVFGLSANMAEQMLHKLVDQTFKPKQLRIKFSNKEKSEWFNIKDKNMEKFLKFCDEKVQLDIAYPPIYGTEFTAKTSKRIDFPERPMITGVTVNERGVVKKKQQSRETNNKYARNERVRRTAIKVMKAVQKEKDVRGAKRRQLEKTVPFWEKVFVGKTFTDKKMHPEDRGLFRGQKIIDEVFYVKREQIYVGYAPNIRESAKAGAKEEDVNDASGYLTANEALKLFPDLKKKYKTSYDYYVHKNGYEEDGDYTQKWV